jgi:hypothetical protein
VTLSYHCVLYVRKTRGYFLPLRLCFPIQIFVSSVADPDPYVFGPPGSGFISQRYGSGSFYHQAKILIKTLIPYDFLYLKNDVNVPSWRSMTNIAGSRAGSISQRRGSGSLPKWHGFETLVRPNFKRTGDENETGTKWCLWVELDDKLIVSKVLNKKNHTLTVLWIPVCLSRISCPDLFLYISDPGSNNNIQEHEQGEIPTF